MEINTEKLILDEERNLNDLKDNKNISDFENSNHSLIILYIIFNKIFK